MLLVTAGPSEVEAVLRHSHAVWGEGMSLDDYLAFNLAQQESPWGRERYRFLVGRDEAGAIVSSLKLFTLPGAIDGRAVRIAGIGAVFTPPVHRGRGHAAELIGLALEEARREGHALALLLSEIGDAYYARLGFRVLPASEAACKTSLPVPWPKEPDWRNADDLDRTVAGLRPFRRGDLEALVSIHAGEDAGRRFRIERDRPAWEQILLKTEMGHRLRRDGENLLWVIEGWSGVEAYVILKETPGALHWREHGARPGAEARLVDLFWSALARARRRGLDRLSGWYLPPAVTAEPLYPIARRHRASPIVMLRALGDDAPLPELTLESDCLVWELDAF